MPSFYGSLVCTRRRSTVTVLCPDYFARAVGSATVGDVVAMHPVPALRVLDAAGMSELSCGGLFGVLGCRLDVSRIFPSK